MPAGHVAAEKAQDEAPATLYAPVAQAVQLGEAGAANLPAGHCD